MAYIDVERYSFPTLHQKELNDYMKGWNACLKSVLQQPTADVVEVKHGYWIDRSDKEIISMSHPYMCSRCFRVEAIKEPYCNCGAKMDGGKE